MSKAHSDKDHGEFITEPRQTEVEFRSLQVGDDPTSFRTLNEEWIARYFTLEAKDREILGNPEEHILKKGGHIFMMYESGESIGCVALVPNGNGVYELSKMSITPRMRGQRLGRKLLEYVISQAKLIGAKSLFLGSNTRLENAVHLYEAMGFQHVAPERIPKLEYIRANVFMELPLE